VLWEAEVEDVLPTVLTERVVVFTGSSPDTLALSKSDGSTLWQRALSCPQLEHTARELVCVETLREAYCKYPD